jgi:hypothetical protein
MAALMDLRRFPAIDGEAQGIGKSSLFRKKPEKIDPTSKTHLWLSLSLQRGGGEASPTADPQHRSPSQHLGAGLTQLAHSVEKSTA